MSWFDKQYDALKAKLGIDLLRLSDELIELPVLIQDAAELAADANDREHAARHALDVVKAEVSARLRQPGADHKSPSETQIATLLASEKEVQEARQAYDASQYDSERITALVGSLREKSRIINKCSDLIIAGYITPSTIYERTRGTTTRATLNRG